MLLFTIIDQMFPPKAKWTPKDIPALDGKVFIVTGGNTGIGKETCKQLLLHGAEVWLSARSETKADAAIADLERETGRRAQFLQMDLGDLPNVKKAVEEFKSKQTRLDALIANAGVMIPPIEQLTAQGYDLQFGTNVLGHFLLIELLLPLLRSTATSAQDSSYRTRIVWVSSSAPYYFNPPIRYDTLTDTRQRKKLGTMQLYAQSKMATCMLTFKLAKLLEGDYGANGRVIAHVVDPGTIRTDLQRHTNRIQLLLVGWLLFPTPMGAYSQLYAATSPKAGEENGKYYYPWARTTKTAKEAYKTNEQDKVWDWCEEQIKPFL
ncbi:NAD(P)-binding protein [Punctularia strigosozonata HHB-11173 SS5]|uniref:NAD(P)-binding protein n=1 Tax=Punctularia strigosozonata (strain HHB-11173) TaxID=741275 RepID=R7S4S4_PUNST|nr:NAD(P)-binding protein [Punctularia strigosozonata HHB-11173 SS5]EIN04817.1 NAD(P)-binding protein [Punctularia strigosozonata HHB-11173 SS5]